MSTTDFQPSERLRGMRDDVVYLEAELRSLNDTAADRNFDDDEQTRWDDGEWLRHALIAEGIDLEARERATAAFQAGSFEPGDGNVPTNEAPAFHRQQDPYSEETIRAIGTREAAKRAIDQTPHIGGDGKTEMERKLNMSATNPDMRGMDEYLLVHNSDAYSRGFFKLMSGAGWDLEADEKAAIRKAQAWDQRTGHTYDEERGVTLTTANGGALIPAHLDPTVILTNAGTNNPFRAISNVVSITSNVWNGVSSAGVTMAWSTEGGDSSDVAPTFVQKAITAHKAHGTVPVTIEAFEDIQGLGEEIARLVQDGKDRLEATAFTSGTGSGQPKGIVTALYTETSRWETQTTHSAFTSTDLIDAQNLLSPRFQPNASWIASINYLNRIRAFGTDFYTRTVTLDQPVAGDILGKPAYEASDMSTALSNTTNPALVYGDFGHYNIVDRVGLAVEFLPHLFSATQSATGGILPNGRRGWYCYWRVGADASSVTAFVMSVNPAITG